MNNTRQKAYTVGAVGMVVWCAVMLLAAETIAAGISWVLGMWCFILANSRTEEVEAGK